MPDSPFRAGLDPDWRFLVFPQEGTRGRRVDGFVVADVMKDIMAGTASDFGGLVVSSATGGQWNDWARLGNDVTVNGAGFVRFLDDGGIAGFGSGPSLGGGFYVLPSEVAIPSGILGNTPVGSNGLNWKPLKGTWRQVPQLRATGGTAIWNVGADAVSIAQTDPDSSLQIGAWEPLVFELDFLALRTTSNATPEFLLQLSDTLRLALRLGMPPVLEVVTVTSTKSPSGVQVDSQQWSVLRRMDAWGKFDPRKRKVRFALRQLGGRCIWEMDGHALWILGAPDKTNSAAQGKAMPIQWGVGVLTVQATNLRARIEVLKLSLQGRYATVTRRVYKQKVAGQALTGKARGNGHIPYGARIDMSVVETADYIDYTAKITPDADGRVSPLLSQVALVYDPAWVTSNINGDLITRAVTSCTVTHAHPPLQAGTEGEFTLDVVTAKRACPTAANYLKDRCRVEISARWRDESGTPIEDYRGLLRGYTNGTRGEEQSWNQSTLSFTVRDPIVRLQSNAGLITGRAKPLDFAFWDKLDRATADSADWEKNGRPFVSVIEPGGGTTYRPLTAFETSLYDVECVQSILGQALGPDEAANLNGGDLFRYLPSDHPALLSLNDVRVAYAPLAEALNVPLSSASLKAQNGFIFEPPYKRDWLSWIGTFCKDLICLFFYGNVDRDTNSWPVPIYGRYDLIMARSRLFEIDGRELSNLSTETRPEADYSAVWVLGNNFDAQIPLSPSLFQGEARLPASHPNSGAKSWERTLLAENNLAISAASAMATAAIILAELDNGGELGQWPTYEYRAAATASKDAQVGDVFWTQGAQQLESVNGIWFRAPKISHRFTSDPNKGRDWKTTANLQRLSRSQLVRFARANGLPIPA